MSDMEIRRLLMFHKGFISSKNSRSEDVLFSGRSTSYRFSEKAQEVMIETLAHFFFFCTTVTFTCSAEVCWPTFRAVRRLRRRRDFLLLARGTLTAAVRGRREDGEQEALRRFTLLLSAPWWTMAAVWTLLLSALLSAQPAAASTEAHNHSGETDTYQVSVGHLFLLKCLFVDAHSSVTWSRGEGRGLSRGEGRGLPPGVEVRDGLLWFLPVQVSHAGAYTCEKRDQTGYLTVTFGVSVSSGKCPDPPENKSIAVGVTELLSCKQKEILKLNSTRNVRWVKDCRLTAPPGERVSVTASGLMRLSGAAKEDSGKYTCLVDVSVDGRTYTAARSIRLTVDKDITETLIVEPLVVYPQQEVVVVEEGSRAELGCFAYIGFSEDEETLMYWTVNEDHTDDLQELEVSLSVFHRRGRVFGRSTLSISKVLPQFLNVPISCCVLNSAGFNVGVVWLQEADHSALYTTVGLLLSSSLAVLLLFLLFFFFRVDVVLAHRKLLSRFSRRAPDGKRYDAYVSFLPPGGPGSAELASLALQVLPEELEKLHGYSLFIRGRDDCPGEAMHDVIAATVRKCRRLIIILSPAVNSSSEAPLGDDQNQLCYEQKVGLFDALTQNDPRVILVEIGGPVDYSVLPESLRFIRRKQGALKWKRSSLRTNKLTKLRSNRNFWKNLRYLMPPVPVGRLQTVV